MRRRGALRPEGQGLGRLLLEEIVECCQRRGIREIWDEVLRENAPMVHLARKLGFLDQDGPRRSERHDRDQGAARNPRRFK
ncbi:MAG: N-acetyltransferase family protein [Rhodoplanes sp.]